MFPFKGQFFFYLECAKIFINIVFGGGLVAKSCLTLAIPMVGSPPGSYVLGIVQARVLEGVAICFSRGSFPPRNRTPVSCIAGILYDWVTRESLLPGGSVVKNPASAEDPWVRKKWEFISLKEEMATFLWRRKWYTFPAVDRRPWLATVQGFIKSWTQLSMHTHTRVPPASSSPKLQPAVLKQLPLLTLGARFPHQV